jgi:hypothetical protein
VTGATTLNSLTVTNAVTALNLYSFIYPTRSDNYAQQTTWFLASHPSYGLWCNTGLYLSGGLTCGAGASFASAVTVATNLTADNLYSFLYPTRVDNYTQQTSWYLASHPSYGLYCNTGLFVAGGVTCNGGSSFGNVTVGTVATGNAYVLIQSSGGPIASAVTSNIRIGNNVSAATYVVDFTNPSGSCGAIYTNGTTTVYLTSSDKRLKRDRGVARETTVLEQTEIHDYDWPDGTPGRGVFSQDAHKVLPIANVPGTDERDDEGRLVHPWMTDYAKYVPDLIVGWQQHDAAIAALRAEIAALKGQA